MKKILAIFKRLLAPFLWTLFCVLILVLSVRGNWGNPTSQDLNRPEWKEAGPLELSPERGRYALVYSLIEDQSFYFSSAIAKFTAPDLAINKDGKYVSLFAPGVSFMVIPGYLIGRSLGLAQVGSFAVIGIFAILNFLLIRAIAIRLGAKNIAATIGALVFIFATPAFAYAVDLYQHHISTLLVLVSAYLLIRFKNIWSSVAVFIICGLAIPVDYPNIFLLFPLGLIAFGRLFAFKRTEDKGFTLKINFLKIITPIVIILPLIFLGWFQLKSYGSPFQLAGTLQTVPHVNEDGSPDLQRPDTKPKTVEELKRIQDQKTAVSFFWTRNLLNGFYLQFFSPDRGILYYTPVIFLSILGMIWAYFKKVEFTSVLISIIGFDVLLYAMWGDPWGGWAFGSRYLIPAYAIAAIYLGLLLTYWRRNILFLLIFLVLAIYSVGVNTLGAITSSANPPQVEVLALEKLSGSIQRYTYQRNWDILIADHAKSFFFQSFVQNKYSAIQFYWALTSGISLAIIISCLTLYLTSKERKNV